MSVRPLLTKRPRPRRWHASCILCMFQEQAIPPDVDDLEAWAMEVTRALNRLEDCTRHHLWWVQNHEIPSGLSVAEWDDPAEQPGHRGM